jgi:hypothetical protein
LVKCRKTLVHDLIRPRRIDVAAEGRLILVRHGEHRQQTLDRRGGGMVQRKNPMAPGMLRFRDEP